MGLCLIYMQLMGTRGWSQLDAIKDESGELGGTNISAANLCRSMPDWERLAKYIHTYMQRRQTPLGKRYRESLTTLWQGAQGGSTPAIGYRCERCKPTRTLAAATPDNADRPCATEKLRAAGNRGSGLLVHRAGGRDSCWFFVLQREWRVNYHEAQWSAEEQNCRPVCLR